MTLILLPKIYLLQRKMQPVYVLKVEIQNIYFFIAIPVKVKPLHRKRIANTNIFLTMICLYSFYAKNRVTMLYDCSLDINHDHCRPQ